MARRQRRGWGALRRLPSRRAPGRGRWQASYIGRDNRRHKAPHTFADRLSAERWLSEERRLLDGGDWRPPAEREVERWTKGETVAEFGKRWIAERKVKPGTRGLYESQFALHIKPVLGSVQVRHMTAERVRGWYASLDADKPTRNARVYGLLHSILETAVSDGVLSTNPCQIKGASNATRKRQPVILSVAEVAALADSDKMPERYKALLLLTAWCGLRWGEVTELRRRDVSAGCLSITVERAVTHKGGCRVDTTKASNVRTVAVPPHIRAALKHHLDIHTDDRPEALLFTPIRGGCHLNDKVFADSYYRPALDAIGRTGVTMHMLRHFGGTMAARAGATPAETQRRLGHKTAKAAMLYQAAVDERDTEIAEALSKLAEGAATQEET
ncbi:phage integrase family protein [Mycolicibacterium flavescens]|uniref:tyrosine-type recombinase/integrase n=1 Tax=Mycobacterium neumannii TaxID=2048551 RepID=UPI000B94095E|nr:site-specific integrase [Mycobacterium neumannii]VEG39402.1 phage integrase family protein [Mycolicibacterium flavescens]